MPSEKQNLTTTHKRAQKRWQDAVGKFRHAIHTGEGSLDDLVDSVRVRISQQEKDGIMPYLEEIATSKQTRGIQSTTLKMNPDELKNCKLFYNPNTKALFDYEGNNASTIGHYSKDIKDTKAFVMSKEGEFYTKTFTDKLDENEPIITHAAFLHGKPVEMAGLVSIDNQGKIFHLSSNSGHYAPEALDMYRGIKKLQETMPGIFTTDCTINYYDKYIGEITIPMQDFTQKMEEPVSGVPLHEILRERRVKDFVQYKENLNNAKYDLQNSQTLALKNPLNKLSSKDSLELKQALSTTKLLNISIPDRDVGEIFYSPLELVRLTLEDKNLAGLKKLLNLGVAKRQDFKDEKILLDAASGDINALNLLLKNKDVQEILTEEFIDKKAVTNPLHVAVAKGNEEAVKAILSSSKGTDLALCKDQNNFTPLEIAIHYGHQDIANTISKHLEMVNLTATKALRDDIMAEMGLRKSKEPELSALLKHRLITKDKSISSNSKESNKEIITSEIDKLKKEGIIKENNNSKGKLSYNVDKEKLKEVIKAENIEISSFRKKLHNLGEKLRRHSVQITPNDSVNNVLTGNPKHKDTIHRS